MAQQFLLRGTTLEDASRQASELYGPAARIVRAERVLDGGLGGFLGRRHVEVTVHIPDDGDPAVVAVEPAGPHVLTGRAGIAALLDDADRAEDEFLADASPLASPYGATSWPAPGGSLGGLADAGPAGAAWGDADPDADPVAGSGARWAAAAPAAASSPAVGPAVADSTAAGSTRPGQAAVSTQAMGFDELLERLRSEVVVETRVPDVLSAPGDLVLVAGLGDTAFDVARDMARDGSRWELWSASTDGAAADSSTSPSAGAESLRRAHAGTALGAARAGDSGPDGLRPGDERLDGLRLGRRRLGGAPLGNRRDAEAARARGVETETAAVVSCSLGSAVDGLPLVGLARELGADQVWLVVDARHKADETADWVAAACAQLPVDALAVVGARETRSASSINSLGIPVGWVDGSPAPRTVL
ncbi:hypothetical protein [Sinomonas albida]|uniref:hypothetical protein n=1 Tax=Sinomonas albida TaxID=369942 RepID=UPI0010A90162|nr:hypothetical protein [Sinomonas albida]